MTFRVGMKCVCIDDTYRSTGWRLVLSRPVVGPVYTIREIEVIDGAELLRFEEIRNPVRNYGLAVCEIGFSSTRFRPLVDTKTEISFTQGADPESERYDNRRPVVEPMPGSDKVRHKEPTNSNISFTY